MRPGPAQVVKGTLQALPGRTASVVGSAATAAFDKVSDRVKDAV